MSSIVPDSVQPLHLAREAVRNAAEKLKDAEALFARARWSSAYALAVLALEEVGKAMLCVSAFSNPAAAGQLTSDLRKHQVKLEAAVGLVLAINGTEDESAMGILEQAVAQVPHIHELRMHSLYVDSPDFGVYRTPADVTETDAKRLVGYLSSAVDALGSFTSDEAVDRLTELAVDHAASFRDVMGLGWQLVEVAPERAMEHVRAMFRGEVPEPSDDQAMTSE